MSPTLRAYLTDWRWYACLAVGLVFANLGHFMAGFGSGAGATAFYLHFIRKESVR